MAQFNFGGVMEEVITDEEFPLQKARDVLKDEIVAVLGYGVQGPGQALNMRDNGINVIVGQRDSSASWDRAVADGFVPGKTLFPLVEAVWYGVVLAVRLDPERPEASTASAVGSEVWNTNDILVSGGAVTFRKCSMKPSGSWKRQLPRSRATRPSGRNTPR